MRCRHLKANVHSMLNKWNVLQLGVAVLLRHGKCVVGINKCCKRGTGISGMLLKRNDGLESV